MKDSDPNWLSKIETLKPGDPCEVRSNNDGRWYPGIVEVSGGAYYWRVRVPGFGAKSRFFRSSVRASQRRGIFDPPDRLMEAVRALPDEKLLARLAPEMRKPLLDTIAMSSPDGDVFSPFIEQVRCRGQVEAWPLSAGTAIEREPFEDVVWAAIWGVS